MNLALFTNAHHIEHPENDHLSEHLNMSEHLGRQYTDARAIDKQNKIIYPPEICIYIYIYISYIYIYVYIYIYIYLVLPKNYQAVFSQFSTFTFYGSEQLEKQ